MFTTYKTEIEGPNIVENQLQIMIVVHRETWESDKDHEVYGKKELKGGKHKGVRKTWQGEEENPWGAGEGKGAQKDSRAIG